MMRISALLLALTVLIAPTASAGEPADRWWKGNLHMHSLWTDGTVYPEMAVKIYKDLGYHFIAMTDHDILSRNDGVAHLTAYLEPLLEAEMVPRELVAGFFPIEHEGKVWLNKTQRAAANQRGGSEALLAEYRQQFGEDWVQTREVDGDTLVRLKPLSEVRPLFEEPGRFLMMESVELTGITPVHFNAIHVAGPIPPAVPHEPGTPAVPLMQRMLADIQAHGEAHGLPTLAIFNHPNFQGGVTAEDMLTLPELGFFEVFNGHRGVLNYGDGYRAGTEQMWDIVLAHRAAEGNPLPLYGIAADDAHDYHDFPTRSSSPGRGWVKVRAAHLTPESILGAMRAGGFYASTGVTLSSVDFDGETLSIAIDAEPGVSYTTEFIGTRRGTPLEGTPVIGPDGEPMVEPRPFGPSFADSWAFDPENDPWAVTYRYDDGLGEVLATVEGSEASYTLTGDEWYVRARIISDKAHPNPFQEGDTEVAWVQPVYPAAIGQARE